MHSPAPYLIPRLLLVFCLFAIPIALLTLNAVGLAYIDLGRRPGGDGRIVFYRNSQTYILSFLPSTLQTGSYWFMVAAGIGGILDSMLSAMCLLRPSFVLKNKTSSVWEILCAGLAALRVGIGLPAMIFAFIQYNNSSTISLPLLLPYSSLYTTRQFTLEVWSCQLRQFNTVANDRFEKYCDEGRAARWITLPYILLGFSLFVMAVLAMRKERSAGLRTKSTRGESAEMERG